MLRFPSRFVLLFVLISLSAANSWAGERPLRDGWPHENSNLKPAPEISWGQLDNGLRYMLHPSSGVPGQANIRLVVFAGSLDENEQQLGIAHFIEHMAFNGTRNFGPGELSDYFQSIGMDYGNHVNAFTSPEYTVYIMELPDSRGPQLDTGIKILRDFADGIDFDPLEINRERGVILSEMRGRTGMEMRSQTSAQRLVFAGHMLPDRSPGGTEDSVRTMPPSEFERFYKKYYRPDNMVVLAAGDFDLEAMREKIRTQFSSMVQPAQPLEPRDAGEIQPPRGFRTGVYQITNLGTTQIQFASVDVPRRPEQDSLDRRRTVFERNLAMSLFGERIGTTLNIPAQGQGSYDLMFGANITRVGLQTRGQLWKEGLSALDQLIRFTIRNGFDAREFEWFQRRQLFEIRKLLDQLDNAPPSYIAEQMQQSLFNDEVFIGVGPTLELQESLIESISVRRLNRAFKDIWELDDIIIHISGDVRMEDGKREILREIRASRDARGFFLIPQSRERVVYETQNFGRPGKVISDQRLESFSADLMIFDNNVRFNFIQSDEEPGLVSAIVRAGGGIFDLPTDVPGLREFGLQTLLDSGLRRYSPQELNSIVASTMLSFGVNLNDHDAFTFEGSFGKEDLPTFLGITTEFLSDPMFSSLINRQAKMTSMMAGGGDGFGLAGGMSKVRNMLFDGDNRFTVADFKDKMRVGIFDVQSWIEPAFKEGYLEISLIGDLSKDQAIREVARTLGALPQRRADKLNPVNTQPVNVKIHPGIHRVEFVGELHLAIVNGVWPIQAPQTFEDQVVLQILTQIIKLRINNLLREELGLAYSPNADFRNRPEYASFSMIDAVIDCSPQDIDQISQAVYEMSLDLAQNGVTPKEFDLAIRHWNSAYQEGLDTPGFLLNNVLKRAQEKPQTVEDALALRSGAFSDVTMDQVNAWASQVFSNRNMRVFSVVPKPFVGIFQESENASGGNIIGR